MARLTSIGTGRAGQARDPGAEAAALSGLDNLGPPAVGRRPWSARGIWAAVWPKLLAAGLVIGAWEIIHRTGWKSYVLPGPGTVFGNLWGQMQHVQLWQATGITMRRALIGFALSVLIGAAAGALVSGSSRCARPPAR